MKQISSWSLLLFELQGTQATQCIKLDAYFTEEFNYEILKKGLANMKELRFLHVVSPLVSEEEVRKWKFDEDSLHLPNALRFLSWDNYPFSSLPKTFQPNNLVGLEMHFSNIVKLWKVGEEKPFFKLRFLNFTDSRNLRTLDPSVAPNLEKLILQFCDNLVEVHFQVTPNLKELCISECVNFEKLHMPAECPKLVTLDIRYSMLRTLLLGITPNLEKLSLVECTDMVELHMPAECPKLVNFELSNLKLTTLHLGITPNLETLKVNDCTHMVELQIPVECSKLVNLDLNIVALKTLDLGNIPNLEWLNLKSCYDLVEINAPIGCLKKLVHLDLSGGRRFKSFVFNKEPVNVTVGSLSELHLIAESIGTCPSHSDNDMPKLRFTCFYEEGSVLPLGNLEKLISFGLCACTNLESFSGSISGLRSLRKLKLEGCITEAPKGLDQLECLEELIFLSAGIKHLPNNICMLKHLKLLELKSCWLIEKLPEDLVQLECLEELYLTECIFLRYIPESICGMSRLKYFHLPYCFLVEKLPEELGQLKCLKELNIEGTGISHLPLSIFRLEGLRILGTRWRLESYGFTSVIQHSRCTSFCYV